MTNRLVVSKSFAVFFHRRNYFNFIASVGRGFSDK